MSPAASPAPRPSVPRADMVGFSQMTTILAFVATKPTHTGGAYAIR